MRLTKNGAQRTSHTSKPDVLKSKINHYIMKYCLLLFKLHIITVACSEDFEPHGGFGTVTVGSKFSNQPAPPLGRLNTLVQLIRVPPLMICDVTGDLVATKAITK